MPNTDEVRLPNELWREIGKLLENPDLYTLLRVSQDTRCVSQDLLKSRLVEVDFGRKINTESLAKFLAAHVIYRLKIDNCNTENMKKELFEVLGKCEHLEELRVEVDRDNWGFMDVEKIGHQCPGLKSLHLLEDSILQNEELRTSRRAFPKVEIKCKLRRRRLPRRAFEFELCSFNVDDDNDDSEDLFNRTFHLYDDDIDGIQGRLSSPIQGPMRNYLQWRH